MVSEDPLLQGKVLQLRPSQIKFEGRSRELDSEFALSPSQTSNAETIFLLSQLPIPSRDPCRAT